MTTLVICTTCGRNADDPEAITPGTRLADLVENALKSAASQALPEELQEQSDSQRSLRLQRTRCLMSCTRSCTAALHHPGKYSYVFGDLAPDQISVDSVLGYVHGYRQSSSGQVPFKLWPEGIKGHFVARIPPLEHEGE